ncbi:MAG: antitoxin MazE family protein [Desulfatitalea sp.]
MAANPAQKMGRYRAKLRASGLRPVQIWLPDIRSKAIVEEIRRQSLRVSSDPKESEAMDFVESLMDDEGWE